MPKRHRPGISAPSVIRHVEDIVVATSGEDAFEVVFAVAAARLAGATSSTRSSLREAMAEVATRHTLLEVNPKLDASDELLARVDELLGRALADESTIDAVFESLVPRLAKADKGQFFTPRNVVDMIMALLAPTAAETVIDPACGSGAFLSRARKAGARTIGCDVDGRAVRVARLLAVAANVDPGSVRRADGLRTTDLPLADVVATNPPFAGRANAEGFATAEIVRTPERDVLFLERAVDLLRPGGRLGIVLPYNKASGEAFAALRGWLLTRARVLAVVGLPRETFLPHTSQRTFVLFARKRLAPVLTPDAREETLFVVSERSGKDSSGEPVFREGRSDHDLDDVVGAVRPFLRAARQA